MKILIALFIAIPMSIDAQEVDGSDILFLKIQELEGELANLRSELESQGYLLELESIAAAVIGGVSLFGGVGTIFGAAIGAILIRFLESGIIMARIDAEWFRAGLGSLIIISVVFNTWVVRRGENMVHKNNAEEDMKDENNTKEKKDEA